MEETKVLYNDACGDWSYDDEFFSNEFLETYKERYGKKLQMYNDSYRYDPDVVALYEELGQKRSSYEGSVIKICKFPTKYLNCLEIKVYEGSESVMLSREKAYKLLLDKIIAARTLTEDDIAFYTKINEVSKRIV